MYRQNNPLRHILASETIKTQESVAAEFGAPLEILADLFDAQFEIVGNTAWLLGQQHLSGRNDTEAAVFSAIHKNFFLFHSAITLAQSGMYGPAGTLLRPIFESLYIAKYCALSKNDRVFTRWIKGEYVHLTNEVFNRVKNSSFHETRNFWKVLNGLSHATVYAQQISASYEEIKTEIGVCFSLIQILSVLNHHLLARHYLTSQFIRYTRIHGDHTAFETARARARDKVASIRSSLTKDAKQVVREYVSAWEIKFIRHRPLSEFADPADHALTTPTPAIHAASAKAAS
jgi:hypothetical protein